MLAAFVVLWLGSAAVMGVVSPLASPWAVLAAGVLMAVPASLSLWLCGALPYALRPASGVPRRVRALSLRVLAWLGVSVAADVGTSVLCMWVYGAGVEGNAVVREAFLQPGPQALAAVAWNQWAYLALASACLALYAAAPSIDYARGGRGWRRGLHGTALVALGVLAASAAWYATLRWGYGVGSNLIQLASPLGWEGMLSAAAASAAVAIAVLLVLVRRFTALVREFAPRPGGPGRTGSPA